MNPPVGKSGPWTCFRTSSEAGVRIVDHLDGGVDDFREVVRRDVGGHADRDAVGAVDDEVGNAGGQDVGLEGGLVVVGDEVDGVHFNVGEQFAADFFEAALGVPHGGRRIAIDGAEISLAVDQGIAHAEGLRHADERVVDGGVAVGVVNAHGLADDLRALGVLLVRLQTHLVHGVKNAAMDGLEAVAGIGKRAPDDDRHGVVEIRAAHLVFNIDGDEIGCAGAGGTAGTVRAVAVGAGKGKLGVLIVCHSFLRAGGCARRVRLRGATEDLSL